MPEDIFKWLGRRESGERTRPRPAAAGASRRKTVFGETPNTTREDAYAPQKDRRRHHSDSFWHLL